jgi:hypothetical protein
MGCRLAREHKPAPVPLENVFVPQLIGRILNVQLAAVGPG